MGPSDPSNSSTSWHNRDLASGGTGFLIADITKLLGVQITLIAAYSLIILLGLVGNSLVIYMIIKYKNMRTVTNYFIANLALADLMVDSLCLPFTLVYTLLDEWKFGAVMCHLVPYSQALSVHLASDLDLIMKFEEYKLLYTVFHVIAMCSTFANPLLYGWMNKNYRNGFLMFFRCEHKPEAIHLECSMRTKLNTFQTVTMNGSHKWGASNGHPPTAV
ncbi:UNVERIFIED_CONTAM: hypothetical protein FKN15_004474 [Acipenser sinensis]